MRKCSAIPLFFPLVLCHEKSMSAHALHMQKEYWSVQTEPDSRSVLITLLLLSSSNTGFLGCEDGDGINDVSQGVPGSDKMIPNKNKMKVRVFLITRKFQFSLGLLVAIKTGEFKFSTDLFSKGGGGGGGVS